MKEKKSVKSLLAAIFRKSEMGAVIPLIVLLLVAACVNPSFISIRNISDILRTAAYSLMIAVPITFLMAEGQLDLSIGATTSLGGVVCVMAMVKGCPMILSIILGILAGTAVGILNGILVVKYDLPAFIATLGMQYSINGLISIVTGNKQITGVPDVFKSISQTRIGGVLSIVLIYALIICIIGHIVLTRTKFGRNTLAVGGNRETARLAGVNVKKMQILVFAAVGFLAALTGVLLASRFASAQPSAGSGTELTIMASVIIGGTSMFGGNGTVVGSAIGCILFAMISNALILMGIPSYWQNLIFGIVLILAIFIDGYRQKAARRA